MNNYLILDSSVICTDPIKMNDYTSALVMSLQNKPLFINNKKSEIVDFVINKEIINMKIKNVSWSSGEKITGYDIKNYLLFIVENNSFFSAYLDIIDDFPDISKSIVASKNEISILTRNPKLLIDILSNPQFGLLKIKNGKILDNIFSGYYKYIKNKLVLNGIFENFELPKEISIIVESNLKIYMKLLTKKNVLSCPTYYDFTYLNTNKENIIVEKNNLLYFLKVQNTELKQYILNKIQKIKFDDFLKKGLTSKFFFIDTEYQHQYIKQDILRKELSILLPDYYPNEEIIKCITNSIGNKITYKLKKLKMKEYISENHAKYDIVFQILAEFSDDQSLKIEMLENFKINNAEILQNNEEELYNKTSLIPLFSGNNIYISNGNMSKFKVSKYGVIYLCK
ncbi:MAG: hypothetical protein ACRC5R_01950 [Mycoplasmatales bacterium]